MRIPRFTRTKTMWLAALLAAFAPFGTAGAALTPEGFALPEPGHVFSFPRDHGSHPDFKIEWWYVTGHLAASDGSSFGFEATFFRQAHPHDKPAQNLPESAHPIFDDVFLAHMALTDLGNQRFLYQERINRDGWDASASPSKLDLHNGPWSLRLANASSSSIELHGGVRADAQFDLTLSPIKPLVVFGENSVSRKGSDPNAASYYLTFPRLSAAGELTVSGKRLQVAGLAWMDHEISSSQLSSGLVGWDWLSIQFTDGRELMLYRLRRADGTADPASTLTWVERDGSLRREPFQWTVLDRWKSPQTGADYPSRVKLSVGPAPGRSFTVEPLLKDQELKGSLGGIPYWEGACRVRSEQGETVGSAYLELTGFAQDLKL